MTRLYGGAYANINYFQRDPLDARDTTYNITSEDVKPVANQHVNLDRPALPKWAIAAAVIGIVALFCFCPPLPAALGTAVILGMLLTKYLTSLPTFSSYKEHKKLENQTNVTSLNNNSQLGVTSSIKHPALPGIARAIARDQKWDKQRQQQIHMATEIFQQEESEVEHILNNTSGDFYPNDGFISLERSSFPHMRSYTFPLDTWTWRANLHNHPSPGQKNHCVSVGEDF